MTMISTATGLAANTTASGGIVRWLGREARALAAHLRRRTAIKSLHELDDRMLRDIGLARDQIETAVHEIGRLR
jgi:uncharacterized protein YjiS (DUF1127 family)